MQEQKRGCGFRHVGGTYLVGNYISIPCDRLPYPLHECPVCGAGIHFTRGVAKINPLKLFGVHENCVDKFRPCFICDPTEEPAYLMFVGERYYKTPEEFSTEAKAMGVSKRIPGNSIPKDLEVGNTIIYLAHPKACRVKEPAGVMQEAMAILDTHQPRLCDVEQEKPAPGIFSAFIPQRIERLFWESELKREKGKKLKESLAKKGITPIAIKNGDNDHS